MIGTLLNVFTIVFGGIIGLSFGKKLPPRVSQTVIAGMGLFTGAIGLQLFLKTENTMYVLGGLLIGSLLGEWWGIEDGLHRLGAWLEKRFGKADTESAGSDSLFIRGFLTASLLFIIGPMAILGSIQDGLTGDISLLAIKATLDGFASIAFTSSLGIGVIFSALPVLVYQGAISLLAHQAQSVISPAMMNEMSATGGILLIAISISSLLEIKHIRVGNMLPALVVAPIIVAVVALF